MNEHDLVERLRALADGAEPPTFGPGFADRVMARLADVDPAWERARALRRLFARVAPAALAASIVLAAYSLSGRRSDSSRSALEVVLGLPEVTLEAAYEFESGPAFDRDGSGLP